MSGISLLAWTGSMSLVTLVLKTLEPRLGARYQARGLAVSWTAIALGWLLPFRPPLPQRVQESLPTGTPVEVALPSAGFLPTSDVETNWINVLLLVVGVIWVGGSFIQAAKTLHQNQRFLARIRQWGTPVTDPAMLAPWKRECERMKVAVVPEVWEVPGIGSPMVSGLRRPLLLLPRGATLPPPPVLRHEIAHVVRKDPLLRLILVAVLVVQWWNPLVRVAVRGALDSAELACDQLAISKSATDEKKAYADFLIQTIRQANAIAPLATSFTEGQRALKIRLSEILDSRQKRTGTNIVVMTMGVLALIGVPVAVAMESPGPEVGEGPAGQLMRGTFDLGTPLGADVKEDAPKAEGASANEGGSVQEDPYGGKCRQAGTGGDGTERHAAKQNHGRGGAPAGENTHGIHKR